MLFDHTRRRAPQRKKALEKGMERRLLEDRGEIVLYLRTKSLPESR